MTVATKKPLIGITCSMDYAALGRKYPTSQAFDYVHRSYYEAVERSRGLPIALPNSERMEQVVKYLEIVDGLLISGGNDVDPSFYKERKKTKNVNVTKERDLFEIALVRKAKAKRIPILAICRGMQLVNVAFGGNLYQDFSFEKRFSDHTLEGSTIYKKKHSVKIDEESKLFQIVGKKRMMVNTSHHQMVRKVAPGFAPSAWSEPDGVIEGMETKGDYPIICVQWHPELMQDKCSKALFDWLVWSAQEFRSRKEF